MLIKIIVFEKNACTDETGRCPPYPCPFAIKVYLSGFHDSSFNGYYVINPPASINYLEVTGVTAHIQTYKHISKNLYIYPNFKKLDKTKFDQEHPENLSPKTGVGHYYITNRPWSRGCIGNNR